MAIKKSELYSSLWQSCDELRGGMDASQYKDYVLVLLFVKYVSDKYAGQPFAPITIPPGAGFKDMVALKGKSDIGDQINKKILAPLAEANKLSEMPDFDDANKLGSGKDKVDKLTNLIAIFENPALDFSKNRADGDDILGDAYEYLMRHFATESGKSKGQFYTPAEVSRVMAQVIGIRNAATTNYTTVCDPTCGSGSLLLKVGEEANHGNANVRVTLYGQEKDSATAALARMNMILHDNPTAMISQGNTLTTPHFMDDFGCLKTFDYVVANPPFSDKRWSTGLDPATDPFERFEHYGTPPAKQGDFAYLLHILRSLKTTGKGACILPHGVLFRGNAEGVIRKNLVRHGYIKAIIGLPANLFYGTGIPACIILLDKEHASERQGIFMIDASKGFIKDGPKNRLREQDLHRIVDTYARQIEVPRYARMVSMTEISNARNDYNLNLPRYIDSTEPEDLQDIDGHLRGGLPERDVEALAPYWGVIPGVRSALFEPADRPGYSQLKVNAADIKSVIFGHEEFAAFNASVTALFMQWKASNTPHLKALAEGSKPKVLIETLAEDLLARFEHAPLLNAYDIYQHLMDYWDATLQDDVYLIVGDGWLKAAKPRLIIDSKSKKIKEKPDFIVGKLKYRTELIAPALIINRYFALEQAVIEQLEANVAAAEQAIEEMTEEHGGEYGLLEAARNEKDKLTKASVAARTKEISGDSDADDERDVLARYQILIEKEATDLAGLKVAQDALNAKVSAQYGQLDEDDIKVLVVDDKWMVAIAATVQGELNRVSQTLTGRVRELAERYAKPLPQLNAEIEALSAKVDEHLKKMGASWN
jgi:type I restriction enzyme M protein